ncbi:MAG: metallophosphoesterase [Clostridia bacterium]|nr:metallophosphoesterase [Clostridia bacterium]
METTQEKVVGSAEEEKARKKSVKKAKRRKRAKRFFIGFVAIVLAVIILTAVTNTIIYKSLLNKVHSFSAADSAGIDFEYYDNGKANIYTDNGLKLLQITDVHIGAGWMCPNKDTMALNAVAAMVTAEKPDLVMVTGDVGYPVPFQAGTINNKTSITVFAELMETLQVYWVYCFGNHDTESYSFYSREKIVEYLDSEKYPHCLLQNGPVDIDGSGNQIFNIINSDGVITRTLFTFDSHAYAKGHIPAIRLRYDNLHQNQIDWYEKSVKEIEEKNKDTISSLSKDKQKEYKALANHVPSSIFLHIPLTAYRDAWDEYLDNGMKDTENVRYNYGIVGEPNDLICCGANEDNMFETMLRLGSTDSVFCGHDHLNNISFNYKGINLTYGKSIDYLAYYGIYKLGSQRGCTVINIDGDGNIDFHPESYYQDKYVSPYEKEEVTMQQLGNH